MAYKRQISYMDYMEQKIKRGNAGFVKWEKYDECHILSVFAKDVKIEDSKMVNVELENGFVIGRLTFKNGRAEGNFLLTREQKEWVENIALIRIPLEGAAELLARFETSETEKLDVESEKMVAEEREESKDSMSEDKTDSADGENVNAAAKKSLEIPIPKSSWEKFGETHELVYPFSDARGCFRIFPKDIALLDGKYHSLQNNQFLMHGYYNYRHLILFPKGTAQTPLWLGVPGIYHEREKMAARMFGFEKFEGVKQNYRIGDLGYYLITVEG